MTEMQEAFIPQLNEFTELLKSVHGIHAAYIKELAAWQKEIREEHAMLADTGLLPNDAGSAALQLYKERHADFEKSMKAFRTIFQQQIDDTNIMLGRISGHWGGYIESIGVQYMLNMLRKEHGVHTYIEKFKRLWGKTKNVEIDLLATSDTHLYIGEVKNQLKPETFSQMLIIMEKIKEKLPEYSHLKIQPIFFCMHAEERIVNATMSGGLWILRYKGFDRENPQQSFEWLRREDTV